MSGKMSPEGVNKQLKKYAAVGHSICDEVPLNLHAHQIRHAKASHWLEDGMNIVQISFLLGARKSSDNNGLFGYYYRTRIKGIGYIG